MEQASLPELMRRSSNVDVIFRERREISRSEPLAKAKLFHAAAQS